MSCEIKSKKKNVQFDIVNTTSSAIALDLFDSTTLTPTPTPENITFFPANSEISQISTPPSLGTRFNEVSQVSGNVYITDDINNVVYVYDSNGNFVTNIITPTTTRFIIYNNLTDEVYVSSSFTNRIYFIDCASNTLTNTINLAGGGSAINNIALDTLMQRIIIARANGNIQSVNVVGFGQNIFGNQTGGNIPVVLTYDSDSDYYWIIDNANNLWFYDVLGAISTITPAQVQSTIFKLTYLQGTNTLYASGQISFSYTVIDTLTGTNLFTEPTIANSINLAIDNVNNLIYVAKIFSDVYVYDLNTNLLITIINSGQNTGQGITFSALNNRMYLTSMVSQTTYVYTTIQTPSSPYYIGGAVDYNFFLQNLQTEPIKLDCLKVISQNQDQLNNVISILKVDADGHSKEKPEFPILNVSAWQNQGDRASVPFNGLILDGRTFFSQYIINAGETVVFELCYEQINRFCFGQHPELFTSLKPIAKEEKEKIENRIIERDKQESGDTQSKFEIIKDSLVIDISVTNNTANTSTFNFFQANQNQLILNTPSLDFADIDAYNYLVQQLRDSPLVLNAFEVVSSDQNQLTLPINVTTKDANGDSITYQHFPINKVSSNQQDGNRAIIKTNHLILDGYTTFADYNILPNTTISIIIYYRQFKRSLFLKNHYYMQLKKPIFSNGMGFAEEIEYFNEVSKKSNNKNSLKNNSINKEKNINFGTEQVYSVAFNGERTANPFLSVTKNQVIDKSEPINQEKYNYRDFKKRNQDKTNYKSKIY